jgi:ABC-type multidrug transport system fused ATPase/permease subunit
MLRVFQRYVRLLGAYLAPRTGQVVLLAALVFSGIGLQLLGPQIIGRFLDDALAGAPAGVLTGAALLYLFVAILQRSAGLAALFVGERIGWHATNALRADLARHVLALDLDVHTAHTPGALIERLDGDATALANFFAQFSVRVLGNALLIGGILAVLWREDWRIALGLGLYALLSLGVLAALQRRGVRRFGTAIAAETRAYGFLEERLVGLEDLRGNGAEAHTLREYAALLAAQLRSARAARLTSNLAYAATGFFAISGYAAGLGLGAWLFLNGAVSLGSAFLIVAYVGMLAAPLEQIRSQAQDLQQAGAAIERIEELFAEQPRVREHVRAALPAGPLAVAFDQVRFAYAADGEAASWRLAAASWQLPAGSVLGVIGRTGSGKSTLARLLVRLYDPQSGAIRLGGVDLRDLALDDLRARVGVVTQEVQIFAAGVRDNLTFFAPDVDAAQLEAALRVLGLWAWVSNLPAGLATVLSGAHGLSAGEAQLLAFARVFLKNPGLVILDEASARLDPTTEQLLERAINGLLANRTAIIIAHRLQTVQRADLIMVLDEGRVVEFGPREQLAADPESHFARLLRAGMEEALT